VKVLVIPADRSGCGFYRMREPALAVADAFSDVEVEVTERIPGEVDTATGDLLHLDVRGADVVVLQRTTALRWVRQLHAQGVAVVVDIDDLLSGVSPGHSGHRSLIASGAAKVTWQCAREADMVTVSTPALLAEYARHGRGAVIPNAIPRRVAELPPAYERTPDVVAVGWTGVVHTHPYDLHMTGSGVQQALAAAGSQARFVVLGKAEGVRQALALDAEPAEAPWRPDVDSYLQGVGDELDVGIAPLRDDRFNTAKSWLKPLEYAARGVLGVYSPTPEYRRLDIGVPASRPRDWAKLLTRAIRHGDWRREQAAANRERVLASHLTEHTADRWMAAWRQAADNRAHRAAA
jgi:hypothetical protein